MAGYSAIWLCWLLACRQVQAVRYEAELSDSLESGVALAANSSEESALVAADPDWNPKKAVDRCKYANRMRIVKRLASVVVVLPATLSMVFLTGGLWFGSLMTLDILGFTFFTAFPAVAWPVVGPVMVLKTFQYAARLVPWSINKFFGGGRHPSCCCPTDPAEGVNGTGDCVLVATSAEANWQQCPPNWVHDPQRCQTIEADEYSATTFSGCPCKYPHECKSNELYTGHAWCTVMDSAACSHARSWDYCVPSKTFEVNGTLVDTNQNLIRFEPNVPRRGIWRLTPRSDNVFKIGGWYVDSWRAVALGRPGLFKPQECYAAIPEETLDGCAARCLETGAPDAKMMLYDDPSKPIQGVLACEAFAYNRKKHLCVRLPDAAKKAEFFPWLKAFDGDGWQNFKFRKTGESR